MENYYKELPEGYKVFKVIDAKDSKKDMIIMAILSLVLMILAVIPFLPMLDIKFEDIESNDLLIFVLAFFIPYIIYIILHELTHGIVYKIMTKQKLTYGFTLTVAFCGVPNIYVSKKTALMSVLAPFVVYTILFIPLIFIIPNGIIRLAAILLFAGHFGGCIGDLWVTGILLKNKGNILMNDTGPKQTFYRLENLN